MMLTSNKSENIARTNLAAIQIDSGFAQHVPIHPVEQRFVVHSPDNGFAAQRTIVRTVGQAQHLDGAAVDRQYAVELLGLLGGTAPIMFTLAHQSRRGAAGGQGHWRTLRANSPEFMRLTAHLFDLEQP